MVGLAVNASHQMELTTFPSAFSPSINVIPEDAYRKLLFLRQNYLDELSLIFTGDPQYYYPCTTANRDCKKRSAECYKHYHEVFRKQQAAASKKYTQVSSHVQSRAHEQESDIAECVKIESTVANEIQRKSIFDLNRNMQSKPRGLVINGDITNFGHIHQLALFKNEWLTLPVQIYAGLGNHDYENNVNDCVANHCAENMLSWFVEEYAKKANLSLDHSQSNELWRSAHEGSLAYSKDICSDNGNCVHLIQLHNRPDYATSITASSTQWNIRGSFSWMANDLQSVRNKTWPVLINLHNFNQKVAKRLIPTLEQWMNSTENQSIIRRVMVLFAHIHENHSVRVKCVGGVTVPFIYVGSVPNNRYTLIKFHHNENAEIFLLKANANSTLSVPGIVDFVWRPCN
ncbi:calcineurin-like phosphoesterase domain-containing protein [Ditylenchus destructor]|nr:calcineurin-like phosphoesterase domain-containing protein [Ditylenchus destructor]